MADDATDMNAILKAVADAPRRDNSAYHKAMAEARAAFEAAETAFDGAVSLSIKVKTKKNGDRVVKFTFSPAGHEA